MTAGRDGIGLSRPFCCLSLNNANGFIPNFELNECLIILGHKMLNDMKKVYCLLTFLVLCCYGCKKENDFNFVNPSIKLNSMEVVAPNQAQLKVAIDLGAGFKGHQAWIQLTDISTPTNQPTFVSITLTQEVKQEHTLLVKAPVAGSDYQVKGILETEKNRFETGKQHLFFSRKSHRYDVGKPYVESLYSSPDYPFLEGNVARITQGGEMFWVQLDNKEGFEIGKAEVILNQSIALECVYENNVSSIGAKLPVGIEPGDYTVQLILDGEKWDVDGLVRIQPWKTGLVELASGQPYSFYGFNASFTLADQIYYVQYHEHNLMEHYAEYKVWSYDVETGNYSSKKNWKLTDGQPVLGIDYNGEGYCFTRTNNYEVYFWKYMQETDEWEKFSSYPGKGKDGYVYFTSGDYLYMGGGVDYMADKHVGVNDFWRFNFQTNEWEVMSDIPFTPVDRYSVNSTCTDGETAYTFFYDRTLWSYHVPTNHWKQESQLNSGPFFHYNSPMCMWEGKVCLIGSHVDLYEQYKDIQLYDPATQEWTLKGLFDFDSYMSMWFIPPIYQKDGSIYMGPLQRLSNATYNPPAPQFIKITPQ